MLGELLRKEWGEDRWREWRGATEREKIAEVLGLKGECSRDQIDTIGAFFGYMERHKMERESGARANALR